MARPWRPTAPDEWETPAGMHIMVVVLTRILRNNAIRYPEAAVEGMNECALDDECDAGDYNLHAVHVCLGANRDIFREVTVSNWTLIRPWRPTTPDEWETPNGMHFLVVELTHILRNNAITHPADVLGGMPELEIEVALDEEFEEYSLAAVFECLDANPDRFRRAGPNHWALAGVGPPIGPPLVT